MKFRTVYDRQQVRSCAGEREIPQYKMHVDKDGVRELKQYGTIDGYAKIQSHKDSCDVNYILERFARGDESALSKIQGVYGDFTNLPTTMAELSQRVIDAETMFYQLPLEVRQQFNHSPSEFFAQIGSDKYNQIFKDQQDKLDALEAAEAKQEFDKKVEEQVALQTAVNEKMSAAGSAGAEPKGE